MHFHTAKTFAWCGCKVDPRSFKARVQYIFEANWVIIKKSYLEMMKLLLNSDEVCKVL